LPIINEGDHSFDGINLENAIVCRVEGNRSVEEYEKLGIAALETGEAAIAKANFLLGAELGSGHAMYFLAMLADEDDDHPRCIEWLRKAVLTGHSDASYNLGVIEEENGNIQEAIRLYENAAKSGNSSAMNNLGVIAFKSGDLSLAKRWYLAAAQAGDQDSMLSLAQIANDEGDLDEARKWTKRAGAGSGKVEFRD
jgi:TPR repeat protein